MLEVKLEPDKEVIASLKYLLELAESGRLRNLIFTGDLHLPGETSRGLAGDVSDVPRVVGQLFHLQQFLVTTMQQGEFEAWKPTS